MRCLLLISIFALSCKNEQIPSEPAPAASSAQTAYPRAASAAPEAPMVTLAVLCERLRVAVRGKRCLRDDMGETTGILIEEGANGDGVAGSLDVEKDDAAYDFITSVQSGKPDATVIGSRKRRAYGVFFSDKAHKKGKIQEDLRAQIAAFFDAL